LGINEVRNLVDQVQGWLSYREGELLYNLAKNCSGKGVIVEIGSWKGKSTIWLAKGSKAGNNVSVYAIDPQSESNFEEFNKNIKAAKIDDIVFPIVKKSEDAAKCFNKPVEMIFIDGSHVYDDVKRA
jgi:predicted O-methyltransferase YrrM